MFLKTGHIFYKPIRESPAFQMGVFYKCSNYSTNIENLFLGQIFRAEKTAGHRPAVLKIKPLS
jgi:hypothetical protein